MSAGSDSVLVERVETPREDDPRAHLPPHPPDGPAELLEADSARVEGIHTVLRGTAHVMGRPREVVLRRVPRRVLVALVDHAGPVDNHSWAAP